MTYGFRVTNANGIVNIDEDSFSYVYLGKYQVPTNTADERVINVTCTGYPLVFFDVPYGTVNGSGDNGANVGHTYLVYRSGVQMTRISPVNSNTWAITMRTNLVSGGGTAPPIYLRVFGQLHLNFPNGSGQHYGARVWNAAGNLIFDTGCRQLRLAGNSYDTQLTLTQDVPADSDRVDSKDTSVAMPFNMANKSIMANTRGSVVFPYNTGGYRDVDNQNITTNDFETITCLFWANGSTLYARKASILTERQDGDFNTFMNGNAVYTRIAVIDNNLFP